MKSFLISLALLSQTLTFAYAEDCVNCGPTIEANDELEKIINNLSDPLKIKCEDVLKKDAADEYLANFSKGPRKTSSIKGLKLEGTQDEINYLTKMLGEKPSSSWASAKSCKTVLCALTNMYGSEESAHRVLNIAKRNGYIVSAAKDFNSENSSIGQLFSAQEIQTIDLAYKRLPANFSKLKTLDRLKRMPDGYGKPGSLNAAAYASPGFKSSYYTREGEITFISSAFTSDKSWAPMVAVHELAHHVDFSKSDKVSFGVSESAEFMKLSGWKLDKKYVTKDGKKVLEEKWDRPNDKEFVRDYAGTEPAEDFAEAVAYYMYEPIKLKELDPEKYAFVKKNIFNGREYDKDININATKEELLNRCFKDVQKINLYGNASRSSEHFDSCLDGFIKEFEITDPVTCFYNADVIKIAALEKIKKETKKIDSDIFACDKEIQNNRTQCLKENNFLNNCSLDKCNLPQQLRSKINSPFYFDSDKVLMKGIKEKLGTSGYLATLLSAGLAEKKNIDSSFSLVHQKAFNEKAIKSLEQKLSQENFKFESEQFNKIIYYDMLLEKKTSLPLDSFVKKVLNVASKTKEKNLELIKTWAASESLEDTALFDDLAESLTKFGKSDKKGFFK